MAVYRHCDYCARQYGMGERFYIYCVKDLLYGRLEGADLPKEVCFECHTQILLLVEKIKVKTND